MDFDAKKEDEKLETRKTIENLSKTRGGCEKTIPTHTINNQ
jgi:hypothetical protein